MTTTAGPPGPPGRLIPAAEVSRLLQDLSALLQPLTGYAEMVASGILPPDKLPDALRAINESSSALLERMHDARAELLAPPATSPVIGDAPASRAGEGHA